MMQKRFVAGIVAVTGVLAAAGLVTARSASAPPASTGVPAVAGIAAEPSCNQSGCHAGNPVNNGQGMVEVLGLPEEYALGMEYTLTLRVSSSSTAGSGNRRWGFQVTKFLASDGKGSQAGGLIPGTSMFRSINFIRDRAYLTHTSSILQSGTATPVEWEFGWTAPEEDRGTVVFSFAGNAANGDGRNSGDFIYTGVDSVHAPTVPVEATTWGGVKTREW